MEGKAKVMLSKAKYFQFEAALRESFEPATVATVIGLLQTTFNFDPKASQYDAAQAARIASYRRRMKSLKEPARGEGTAEATGI